MGTIVQEYGPIYGEVVNGTVQGRPNGSVYVPSENVIDWTVPPVSISYESDRNRVRLAAADGTITYVSAESQDLASAMEIHIYSDVDLTTEIAKRTIPAGTFYYSIRVVPNLGESDPLTPGENYYAVAVLVNNGVPVATSPTYIMEASA